MTEKTKSLVTKLAKVMTEVKYIEKRGFNKFNKYKYATESDVSEKVRESLSEQNVIMLPDVVEHSTRNHTTRNGNIEYIATVKVKFTFIDGDTGEELSIHSIGEGQDSGDKAVYKAITGATKYALMKAFMIPTGDDPEADDNTDKSNSGKQQNKLNQKQYGELKTLSMKFAQMNKKSDRDVHQVLLDNKVISNIDITQITENEAKLAITQVKGWIEKQEKKAESK